MSKTVTHEEAAEALDSLDDYARMDVGVDAMGPRGVLERYIAQQAAQFPEVSSGGTGISSGDSAASAQDPVAIPHIVFADLVATKKRLSSALERMDRARNILTNGNPTPDCKWAMLDTADLRDAITGLPGAQTQDAKLMPKEIPDAVLEHSYYINGLFGSRQWNAIWELLPVARQLAERDAQQEKDAARWRMLTAFTEEHQIDYVRLINQIDAALSAQANQGEKA